VCIGEYFFRVRRRVPNRSASPHAVAVEEKQGGFQDNRRRSE
jgi:hypothetical protein